ncbi:hypothetical protein RDV89_11400 [Nocardioides zeae]|uniref:Uncharacterized protein n=1 Tax=Nocardioides imazamoxiresistens TaxID=3231893 RepID=A0ABU3PXR7_9ACTN|nr:hypothetical protein [Nocardioides zeae]MDT9593676.1 hypothetical protein [Nocardioides zeae]
MTDVPRFPVLEAADGYEIAEVDRQVWQLCEEIRRGRRTGLHPGPFDTRPFRLVHRSQVYAPGAVDDWFDGCSAELEARRQHPSAHRPPPYEGDLDDPPELRGADRPGAEPEKFESSIPLWARVVALLVIVGLVCAYVLSYF